MKGIFDAVKVTDHVYWVGAVDWNLREFHGYATYRGSTYNAFLVLAEKPTLIDTVRTPFLEEMWSRISSVLDPTQIRYIVSNHAEMDHTGCLPQIIERIRPEKVFASLNGVDALRQHFHFPEGVVTGVKSGEGVSLGNLTLSFLETRMLHWPDSMFTFLPEEGVLFSQDVFGMHLASCERFNNEVNPVTLKREAASYFANIVMPYGGLVTALVKKSGDLLAKTRVIAPDHGPIWRQNPQHIVDLYASWAKQKPTKKAVIAYDTMWESTELMARAIEEGLVREGAQVRRMRLSANHRSDVATELLDAGALVVGSPTLNGNLFPTVADLLTYLRGLRPMNLTGAAFGSFGWSGEAVDLIKEILAAMRVSLVAEGIKAMYVPDEAVLKECRELGAAIASKLDDMSRA